MCCREFGTLCEVGKNYLETCTGVWIHASVVLSCRITDLSFKPDSTILLFSTVLPTRWKFSNQVLQPARKILCRMGVDRYEQNFSWLDEQEFKPSFKCTATLNIGPFHTFNALNCVDALGIVTRGVNSCQCKQVGLLTDHVFVSFSHASTSQLLVLRFLSSIAVASDVLDPISQVNCSSFTPVFYNQYFTTWYFVWLTGTASPVQLYQRHVRVLCV